MTYANQLAQIVSILEAVTNIGTIHDSLRWSRDFKTLSEAYTISINNRSEIRTWLISRAGGADAYGMIQGSNLGTLVRVPVGSQLVKYDYIIDGFMSFKDNETESEFLALVDAVRDQFKNNISLNSSCFERGHIFYSIDHAFFGDHLCHHINMTFWTAELEGITPS
jgi:hypothetical protein